MAVAPTTQSNDEPDDDPTVVDDPTTDDENVDDDEPPPAPVAAPATVDDEEFGVMTPREKAIVQKARTQEKTKLYGEVRTLKARLAEMERQPASHAPAPSAGGNGRQGRTTRDEEISDLRSSIQTLTNSIAERDRRDAERERRRELQDYRKELIADRRARKVAFVEPMVQGDSEEALDHAMQVAEAEAEYQKQQTLTQLNIDDTGRPRQGTPQRRTSGTTVVVQRDAPRRPDEVPSTVGAGSAGHSGDMISGAELNALTSIESVRDGTFAANRAKIHKAMKEGRISG